MASQRVILSHRADPLFQGSLPDYTMACEGEPVLLLTENETNTERIFGTPNQSPYVKDGFDNYVVHGNHAAVSPQQTGTKAAALYSLKVGAGPTEVLKLRLCPAAAQMTSRAFGKSFDEVFEARQREADQFYQAVTPPSLTEDEARVMRQALAGMLWSPWGQRRRVGRQPPDGLDGSGGGVDPALRPLGRNEIPGDRQTRRLCASPRSAPERNESALWNRGRGTGGSMRRPGGRAT
jgi:hypothetical protein